MYKSIRSGIFPLSNGQYVGLFGVAKSQLYEFIALISSRPFGVIRHEPHAVCFALKLPARMNCFPILQKTSTNISLEILCLGGQYTAPILVSLLLYVIEIIVDWKYSSQISCCKKCLMARLTNMAVPPRAAPLGCVVQ